jgi:hypothetical protein
MAQQDTSQPLRFSHPFFTTTPKSRRKVIPGVGKGLAEYPSKAALLEKIPPPKREPTMTLDEVIGADGTKEITNYGSITIHAVGDTGSPDTMTEKISDAMTADYNIANPKAAPAFLFHLGESSTMTIPTGAISPNSTRRTNTTPARSSLFRVTMMAKCSSMTIRRSQVSARRTPSMPL